MPLFRNNKNGNEKVINLRMSINDYKYYEAGLLLLVLKDLWAGDLTIGGEKNVGRGVLEGMFAEIKDNNGLNINIEDLKKITQSDKDKLQNM